MSMQIDGQAIATGAELGTRNITSTTRRGTMLAQRHKKARRMTGKPFTTAGVGPITLFVEVSK
jgi:hypothetical protein